MASALLIFLSIILFCNVNGIVVMIWEINRAASAFILALCLLSLALLASHIAPSLRGGVEWMIGFYLLFMGLGAAVAFQSPFVTVEAIANRVFSYGASVLVILTYCAFGFLLVRSGARGVTLMKVIFVICCISSLSVLLGVLYPPWVEITKSRLAAAGRYSGFFGNPNELGLQGALTIAVGTLVTIRTGKIVWFSLAVICAGIGAFYSFSKTAILLSMVVSVAMAFLIQKRGINLKNAFAIIVSAGLVLTLIGFVRGVASRSESRIDLTSEQIRRLEHVNAVLFEGRIDDETTSKRTVAFQEAVDIWKKSPVVGNGLTTLDRMPYIGGGPHNVFLMVLGEGGLICLILLLAAMLRFTMLALRLGSASVQAFVIGGLLVLTGAFMVSHNVLDDRNHNALMGLMYGMAAGAPVAVRRRVIVPKTAPLQPPPSYRPVHGGAVR